MEPHEILALLQPYLSQPQNSSEPDWEAISEKLAAYLDLILHWNASVNLTAIRTPEEIVRRHFGESLFTGLNLGRCATLLDFGSGAGFPGIPIQILHPEIHVTLGESKHKKAAFLREAVRTLELKCEVWPRRIEDMPTARRFDVVTLRAVDSMEAALRAAAPRARERLLVLGTSSTGLPAEVTTNFTVAREMPMPGSDSGKVMDLKRVSVPMFHVEHRATGSIPA